MNLSSKELKRRARAVLTGRYTLPMGAFIITQLITMCANLPFELSLQNNPSIFQMVVSFLAAVIIFLLANLLDCGQIYIHLNMTANKPTSLKDLFLFFNRRPDRFILSGMILLAISFAAMAPAVISTVIALSTDSSPVYGMAAVVWLITLLPLFYISLTYSLIYYLLIERPQEGVIDIFRTSRRLMEGHKKRLLYLHFSFLGMQLLCALSFGIGLLWVIPYQKQTFLGFFLDITDVQKKEGE